MIGPLNESDNDLVEEIRKRFNQAEGVHKQFTDKADAYYARYRNFQAWRQQRNAASERDRDTFWNDATREWGAKLSIPFGFSTIETQVPRMLDHNPRLLVLPRDRVATENVQNMKALIDFQQDEIDIDVRLQFMAKDGLMYGLGVGKSFWRTEKRQTVEVVKSPITGQWIEQPTNMTVFDGNDFEPVSIWDFFWDPLGYDMRSCGWVLHRLWMSHEDVMKRVQAGVWRQDWTDEEIRSLSGWDKMNESWQGRRTASGYQSSGDQQGRVHEVWEFHRRDEVATVLDRQLPMQHGGAPFRHGELPFQIYRPTPLNKEFVGVSELEPLQDLLDEMDTLRSQRRDNATLVLQRTFAYQAGLADPADFKMGPGLAWPVDGDPREVLFPLPIQDIPNSSYQEEAALLADIERTSGISDAVAGAEGHGGGASATATGAQLVHAAANVRIKNKTKLLEREAIRDICRQWVSNIQQKVVGDRTAHVSVQQPPAPGTSDPTWLHWELSQAELAGRFAVIPEGGATAPENTAQRRQDAQLKMQLLAQIPEIDKRRLLSSVLSDLGVEMPESWVVQQQQVPASVLEILVAQGVPEEMVAAAVQAADAQQQGADPAQMVAQLVAGSQEAQQQAQAQNGSGNGSAAAGNQGG